MGQKKLEWREAEVDHPWKLEILSVVVSAIFSMHKGDKAHINKQCLIFELAVENQWTLYFPD